MNYAQSIFLLYVLYKFLVIGEEEEFIDEEEETEEEDY